jgi:hypothetical protein
MASKRSIARSVLVGLAGATFLGMPGCGGDARVEFAAADALETLAGSLDVAVREYHADLEREDDAREAAVIAAFVNRLRNSAADPAAQERHVADFTTALGRIRSDRACAGGRFNAAQDNLDTLREVTEGLRRLALESLTLRDEARRYLTALIDTRRAAPAAGAAAPTCRAGGTCQ